VIWRGDFTEPFAIMRSTFRGSFTVDSHLFPSLAQRL
jgi:hypothetical protein